MKLSKKFRSLIAVGAVCIIALTGCSSSDSSGGTDEDYTITVGYYNCDHMTAAPVALEAGIYEELGLTVETVGNGKVQIGRAHV